jgi:hypothetical protein
MNPEDPRQMEARMAERTRPREREPEPDAERTRLYEPQDYQYAVDTQNRQRHGRIVVRGAERPWDMHRQAKSKRYLSPLEPDLRDTAMQDWNVFVQVIPERSGKHRHQGGTVIFILEGRGHTIVDGERHDWQAGDLMLLPIKPGGVEHQHFNDDPDHPARWVALLYFPYFNYSGAELTQLESSPLFDRYMADLEEKERRFRSTKEARR